MSNVKMTLTDEQRKQIEERYNSQLDEDYQINAVGYMYGLNYGEAKKYRQELPEDKIADSIDYYALEGLDARSKMEIFEQKQTARVEFQELYGLSPLHAICVRDDMAFDKGLENIQTGPEMEK